MADLITQLKPLTRKAWRTFKKAPDQFTDSDKLLYLHKIALAATGFGEYQPQKGSDYLIALCRYTRAMLALVPGKEIWDRPAVYIVYDRDRELAMKKIEELEKCFEIYTDIPVELGERIYREHIYHAIKAARVNDPKKNFKQCYLQLLREEPLLGLQHEWEISGTYWHTKIDEANRAVQVIREFLWMATWD